MKKLLGKIFSAAIVPVVVVGLAAATFVLVIAPHRRSLTNSEIKRRAAQELKVAKENKDPGLLNINVDRPEISHLVDGQVVWTVGAKTVKSDMKTGETKLYGTSGIFVREGDSGLEFSSPLTVYNTKTKKVNVKGGVKGRLVPEGDSLTAKTIAWDEKDGMITVERVKVAVGDATASAGRMELDPKKKKVKLSGGVKIEVPFNPQGDKKAE